MKLYNLPEEVMMLITGDLDPNDLFRLGSASPHFKWLFYSQYICGPMVRKYAPYSPEALRAAIDGDFAKALRALWKRRRAITGAFPFNVAIVATADQYIYPNGVLCYMQNSSELRVRDIQKSAPHEIVIKVWTMLASAFSKFDFSSQFRDTAFECFNFYPIYYSHDLLSCIYSTKTQTILIVLRPQTAEILLTYTFRRSREIFVRNTKEFLFLGFFVPCERQLDSHEQVSRWVIAQLNIKENMWFPDHMILKYFKGNDIGGDVCFEIIDSYFYAISNCLDYDVILDNRQQPGLEVSDPHHALRLPVGQWGLDLIEGTLSGDDWKRAYISDLSDWRWNALRLERNECAGNLTVVEVRRDFLSEGFHNRRTCYKRRLEFPRANENADIQANWENSLEADDLDLSLTARHHGDNSITNPLFPYHQCFVRSYIASCGSFVDLVVDSKIRDTGMQKLQLRVMTDRRSSWGYESQSSRKDNNGGNSIRFWPCWSADRNNPFEAQKLESLQEILNPPGYCGNVEAVADDSSIVYAVCGNGKHKKLVYIGFDPSVKLYHVESYYGGGDRVQRQQACDTQLNEWAYFADCREPSDSRRGFRFFRKE